MIASDLAVSVFEQTDLPPTPANVWWVECTLQTMKINGLVKMINASPKKDVAYIKGYTNKFKWAARKDGLQIKKCKATWEVVCDYLVEPFAWVAWRDLVLMNDMEILEDSITKAIRAGVRNISYVGAIYANHEVAPKHVPLVQTGSTEMAFDSISNSLK